jgi:hypothetical protein
MPDVTGTWRPLGSDSRPMTVKLLEDKITITARDLSCTLTNLQSEAKEPAANPPSVTADSVCYDESFTVYAKETLTLLRVGRDVLLVNASVLVRLVNENSEPKIDEAYTNKPAVVTVYRRVRRR